MFLYEVCFFLHLYHRNVISFAFFSTFFQWCLQFSWSLINGTFLSCFLSLIPGDDPVCSAPLGMEDSSIPDKDINSWSPILEKFQPAKARLNSIFAWCSAEDVASQNGPFLQITLDKPHQITGIATKGFNNFWIREYQVEFKVGNSFERYKDSDGIKV